MQMKMGRFSNEQKTTDNICTPHTENHRGSRFGFSVSSEEEAVENCRQPDTSPYIWIFKYH